MTNDFTDDYPRCDFCGKTLFFLDGLYRCPEESSLGWHRETIERKGQRLSVYRDSGCIPIPAATPTALPDPLPLKGTLP